MTVRIILGLSVLANIALVLYLWFAESNEPTYDEGVLTESVQIRTFQDPPLEFELPAGLTVANASPRGIAAAGQFEPFRFMIVVSSDRAQLVSYDSLGSRSEFGPLYSADSLWDPLEVKGCEEVRAIELMPMKGDGDDPAYLSLIGQGQSVLRDLVHCIADQTAMPDPREAPVYSQTTVGDVAFWMFVRITGVSIQDFLPTEFRERWEEDGVYAYFDYVATPENRLDLQAKATDWLDANQSP